MTLRTITIYRDDSTAQVIIDNVKHFFWTADNTVLVIAQVVDLETGEHEYLHWPRERWCWFRDDPQGTATPKSIGEMLSETGPLDPGPWIPFSLTTPCEAGLYWLLSNQKTRILASYAVDKIWRGVDAGGETFKLSDCYTHWCNIVEPTV